MQDFHQEPVRVILRSSPFEHPSKSCSIAARFISVCAVSLKNETVSSQGCASMGVKSTSSAPIRWNVRDFGFIEGGRTGQETERRETEIEIGDRTETEIEGFVINQKIDGSCFKRIKSVQRFQIKSGMIKVHPTRRSPDVRRKYGTLKNALR